MSRTLVARIAVGGMILAATAIVSGFWFHTCPQPSLFGKYELAYFAVAGILTLIAGCIALYAKFLFSAQYVNLSGGRKRLVPLSVKLLIMLVFGGVTFATVEIGANLAFRSPTELDIPGVAKADFHPYLQNVLRRGDRQMHVNRWGFRGEEIDIDKPEDTYRIFVLGGSTVLCADVAYEASHCCVLQQELRAAYPHAKIEVLNAGMDWHTSQHSLIKFLIRIQDFDPDLIVVWHGINDLVRSFSPPKYARPQFESDYGHFHGPVARIVKEHYDGRQPPPFAPGIGELFSRYWFSDLRAPRDRTVTVSEITVSEWPSLPTFDRNMRELAAAVRGKGIELIIASQASLYKEVVPAAERKKMWVIDEMCVNQHGRADAASIARGMHAFNETSRRIAEDLGVAYLDLASRVPRTLEYFKDGVHYTELGNRTIGRAVAECVLQNVLHQRSPGAAVVQRLE